jgi:gliding motility-associated-like protein
MLKNISYLIILITSPFLLNAQEICDNGIDDNGNGLVDLNDPECDCGGFGVSQAIPSLIPNASFEDNSCCPSSYSQLSCADTWIQATTATSDYFNCGYSFGAANNVGLTPPDGSGYVGAIYSNGWMEYVGSCLLQPMVAGETYTLSFDIASVSMNGSGGVCNMAYGDVDVTIYGSSNCGALPVSTTGCPSNASGQWDIISAENYSPNNNWGTITFEITPTQNINAIMIGPPCTLTPDYDAGCYAYFMYDDLILASNSFFNSITIDQQGSFCENDLTLEATADSVGGSWQWYLEGVAIAGETDPILDISGLGLGDGEYNVMYTIGADCDIQNHVVDPPQIPSPGFEFTDVCLETGINFIDTSSIDTTGGVLIDSWSWDFDDGNTSLTQNQSHTFLNSGTYDVTLIVEGNNGCIDSITHSVEVFPLPVSNFEFDTVCVGNTTNFTDLSNANGGSAINDWQWNFDDGSTDVVQNPTNTYANSGNYNVNLSVTTASGCTHDTSHNVLIYEVPTAGFSFNNECYYEEIVFNEEALPYANEFEWFFDDGNTSTDADPSHLYQSAGEYDVSLVVAIDGFCHDTLTQTVFAYAQPEASFDVNGVCEDTTSTFNNLSTVDDIDGDIINGWSWDFGDGTSSALENPTNTYGQEEEYDVSLIVTTNFGCKDTVTGLATVWPMPVVDFSPTDVCLDNATEFNDQSTVSNAITNNNLAAWDWDFGDGGSATSQNPTYSYSSDGSFNATLTVTSNNGCVSDETLVVTVHPLPDASFTGINLAGCTPICPEITSTSLVGSPSTIVDFEWTLSNGTTQSGSSPSFSECFDNETSNTQFYGLTLLVTTDQGCQDTHSESNYIEVYHYPVASFYYEPEELDIIHSEVDFTNTSNYADFYNWTFEGIGSSSNINPTIDYPDVPETYEVELVALTDEGCTDTAKTVIDIVDRIIFYVPNTFTPDNDNFNETFQPVFYSGFEPQDFNLLIFNRWGEIVFESNDASIGWNGTYGLESQDIVKDGTYVWKIEFKETMSDKRHVHRGHVNVLK